MPGKEKVVSTRICGETSCNQILARFPLVKSPTKGLNVLYNPFRERTPGCSIRYCSWAKAHYDALRARGKGHHAALRAVAFKWIRILFACWKQRTPYDPQRYLQALQRRGSPLAIAC
jgi:hypothetical protein